ncbi:endonuclease domain-containing protein [Pelagibacterium halotolerans]|uniref:endonuclease domain-containing protein n=1 Tax=Pelagibacterium halotolerans TaxID=531813 RepID=UPI00384ABCC4
MGGETVSGKSLRAEEDARAVGHPSSDPAAPAHLLPQGEKARAVRAEAFSPTTVSVREDAHKAATSTNLPSPLEGEGGLSRSERSDEGYAAPRQPAGAKWRHENPKRNRGFAKAMRRNPTEHERKLWLILKCRRFVGYKFRRQVPIGPYIADFVCYAKRLIIELDGSQHADNALDAERDRWLAVKGFAILRFWNNELTENAEGVADAIWSKLEHIHA